MQRSSRLSHGRPRSLGHVHDAATWHGGHCRPYLGVHYLQGKQPPHEKNKTNKQKGGKGLDVGKSVIAFIDFSVVYLSRERTTTHSRFFMNYVDPGISRGVRHRLVSFTRVYTPRNTNDRSITRSLQRRLLIEISISQLKCHFHLFYQEYNSALLKIIE